MGGKVLLTDQRCDRLLLLRHTCAPEWSFRALYPMLSRGSQAARMETNMRKSVWCCVLALVVSGCGHADAATPDASKDFDCAVTAGYFLDAAKISGAPEQQQHALYVVNQWYAAKWHHGTASPDDINAGLAMMKTIDRDPRKYSSVLSSCTERATEDPRFSKFADLLK